MSKIKITILEVKDMNQEEFTPPSKWYFINALGQHIYIHCRDRTNAEQYITETYGKGFYKLRTSSLEKNKGEVTCKGTATRKGQKSYN
jgi:phage antirepressor YoqD-like protein